MSDVAIGQSPDFDQWVDEVDTGLERRGFLDADQRRPPALSRSEPPEPTIRAWRCSRGLVVAGNVVDLKDDRHRIELRFEGPESGSPTPSLDTRTRFFEPTAIGADRAADLIARFVNRGFAAIDHDDNLPA